jgi:hypothetical protein
VVLGNWSAGQEAGAAALGDPPASLWLQRCTPSDPTDSVFHITPVMNVSGSLKSRENVAKEDGISLQMGG